MSASPGDQARASVQVAARCDDAFRVFTEEIDLWWRRGMRYRVAGKRAGSIYVEPRVGGRVLESFEREARRPGDGDAGRCLHETGRVLAWEPPTRLLLEWRLSNFAPHERTEVEVTFTPNASGTLVTVTHRGWSAIRADHPARHGLDVIAFVRTIGLWWGELLSSLREHVADHPRQ